VLFYVLTGSSFCFFPKISDLDEVLFMEIQWLSLKMILFSGFSILSVYQFIGQPVSIRALDL